MERRDLDDGLVPFRSNSCFSEEQSTVGLGSDETTLVQSSRYFGASVSPFSGRYFS